MMGASIWVASGVSPWRTGLPMTLPVMVSFELEVAVSGPPSLVDCIVDLGFLDRHVLEREQRNYETGMEMARGKEVVLARG